MECGAEGGLCGKLAIFGGKLKRTSSFHNPRPQWKVKRDVALTGLKDMCRNCYQSGSNGAVGLFCRAREGSVLKLDDWPDHEADVSEAVQFSSYQ